MAVSATQLWRTPHLLRVGEPSPPPLQGESGANNLLTVATCPGLQPGLDSTLALARCRIMHCIILRSPDGLGFRWGSVTTVLLYSPHRSFKRSDPVNPYHVGSGYVFAPATSANDSELSSDALTDDSMSMTDSSV